MSRLTSAFPCHYAFHGAAVQCSRQGVHLGGEEATTTDQKEETPIRNRSEAEEGWVPKQDIRQSTFHNISLSGQE